jgi:uncharacterized protein YcfL
MRIALWIGATAFVLAGCSSSPTYNYTSQYCYTDQLIVKQGDSVQSATALECTDRPARKAEIFRAGIDANCREFWYDEIRFGQRVQQRGVACEKFDGSLEIVNINGNVK